MESVPAQGTLAERFRAQLAEGESGDRTFGLTAGPLLMALGFLPVLHHRPPLFWPMVLGAPLLVTAVAAPAALRPIKRAWLFAGFLMGLVISPVVLAAIFYLVITPCGFLMRLCGADPLMLRRYTPASFWRERSGPSSTIEEQF